MCLVMSQVKSPTSSLAARQPAVTHRSAFTFRRCAAGCYDTWSFAHSKAAAKPSVQRSSNEETSASGSRTSRLYVAGDLGDLTRSFSTARNARSAGSSLLTSPRHSAGDAHLDVHTGVAGTTSPQVLPARAFIPREEPVDYYGKSLQRYCPMVTSLEAAEEAKRRADRSVEEDLDWLK